MLAEEKLRAGNVDEALELLQNEVRNAPSNAKYRVFLFQLLAVLGRWDRALAQLQASGELEASNQFMVETYRELLRCEVLRGQVFAGQKTPIILGEPEQWAALLVEALRLSAADKHDAAEKVRSEAFEKAPTTRGKINGEAFEWIADGDLRIGPMLEVIVHGRYGWLPFHEIHAIKIEEPEDLRDLVWTPAVLTLNTGADITAFIPTRYPGSETHEEGAIRLARTTEWSETAGGYIGVGQRVFVTDNGEYPLLAARCIEFDTEIEQPAAPAEEPTLADG